MSKRRPRILIVLEYYLPGINAGGPVRSVANLIDHLADEADFFVATRDRDLGARRPYHDIEPETWISVGRAQVTYLSSRRPGAIVQLAQRTAHDVLYLSSYFSRWSVELMWARRFGLSLPPRCVIAPRGQFGAGALAMKAVKKRTYLSFANTLRIHAGITWHATNDAEAEQIRRMTRPALPIGVAANLPMPPAHFVRDTPKRPGVLRIVTLARIHPMKNILQAIQSLPHDTHGSITYDVLGPHEDLHYVAQCRRAAGRLPENVRVAFPGVIPHDDVARRLAGYDLFFLPTRGENFGHSIAEAMAAGLPVLISDRTPWRGLGERGAGWVVPLDAHEEFRDILTHCVTMDGITHERMSAAARQAASAITAPIITQAIAAYRQLFQIN